MKLTPLQVFKKSFIKIMIFVFLLMLSFNQLKNLNACEACNRQFRNDLLTSRQGSLVASELLAAINNQEKLLFPKPESDLIASNSPQTTTKSLLQKAFSGKISDNFPKEEFVEVIRRDEKIKTRQTSYVPPNIVPDKYVRITLEERDVYLGNGVMYSGFTTNGKIPGPTIILTEGDIVSFTIVNESPSIPHGASIHSAYTQTSKYLGKIAPNDSATIIFRVTQPGVYMYHCAPGGHAIPMHIIFGQYGMFVVQPKAEKFELEKQLGHKPDLELYLIQHEFYASGKDATIGQGQPMYTVFNGKLFRYVEEPIMAKPGDYVRIYFLNIGPNLLSTFHIVGIIWDYAYWQGHPQNKFIGGQTVTAGPSDSWVIEFRMPPDEGSYLMLSHAVGSTDRGAIGLLVGDKNADTPKTILADGPDYSDEQLDDLRAKSIRTISPYKPGTLDVDPFKVYGPNEEVVVKIQGNSYSPKRIKIAPGTTVTWINEDVFTYMEGEFSGIHNVAATGGPERFASPMLTHAESYSHTFEKEGEYGYMCTPHPYMEGVVLVSNDLAPAKGKECIGHILSILAIFIALFVLIKRKK